MYRSVTLSALVAARPAGIAGQQQRSACAALPILPVCTYARHSIHPATSHQRPAPGQQQPAVASTPCTRPWSLASFYFATPSNASQLILAIHVQAVTRTDPGSRTTMSSWERTRYVPWSMVEQTPTAADAIDPDTEKERIFRQLRQEAAKEEATAKAALGEGAEEGSSGTAGQSEMSASPGGAGGGVNAYGANQQFSG